MNNWNDGCVLMEKVTVEEYCEVKNTYKFNYETTCKDLKLNLISNQDKNKIIGEENIKAINPISKPVF